MQCWNIHPENDREQSGYFTVQSIYERHAATTRKWTGESKVGLTSTITTWANSYNTTTTI